MLEKVESALADKVLRLLDVVGRKFEQGGRTNSLLLKVGSFLYGLYRILTRNERRRWERQYREITSELPPPPDDENSILLSASKLDAFMNNFQDSSPVDEFDESLRINVIAAASMNKRQRNIYFEVLRLRRNRAHEEDPLMQ